MNNKDKRTPAFVSTDLMPFGPYKGKPLRIVPSKHLKEVWIDLCSNHFDKPNVVASLTDPIFQDRIKLANYIYNSKDIIRTKPVVKIRQDPQDISDDLKRLDYGDKKIHESLDELYLLYKQKGLVYRELFASKASNNIRYMLTVIPEKEITKVLVTDLDTNIVYDL